MIFQYFLDFLIHILPLVCVRIKMGNFEAKTPCVRLESLGNQTEVVFLSLLGEAAAVQSLNRLGGCQC